MSGSKKKTHYTIAKVLHWLAVLIIAFNLASGWRIGDFAVTEKQWLMTIHAGVGTSIFLLMLIRWWWRKVRNLYAPPRWWKRPSMLLQWVFYPLVLTQVAIGVAQAAFIDYDVVAFGYIPLSAIATENATLQGLFLQMHGLMAWLLITLIVWHGFERGRFAFIDEAAPMKPALSGDG